MLGESMKISLFFKKISAADLNVTSHSYLWRARVDPNVWDSLMKIFPSASQLQWQAIGHQTEIVRQYIFFTEKEILPSFCTNFLSS